MVPIAMANIKFDTAHTCETQHMRFWSVYLQVKFLILDEGRKILDCSAIHAISPSPKQIAKSD